MNPRGQIDRTVGVSNGRFLGLVAMGKPRDELVRRWKAGEFPDLHTGLARHAMARAGMKAIAEKGSGPMGFIRHDTFGED